MVLARQTEGAWMWEVGRVDYVDGVSSGGWLVVVHQTKRDAYRQLPVMPPSPAATSTSSRLRTAIAQYGRLAIAVHIGVSTVSFAGLYLAIRSSIDVEGLLNRVGLLPSPTHPSSAPPTDAAPPSTSHSANSLEREAVLSGSDLSSRGLPDSSSSGIAGRKADPGSSVATREQARAEPSGTGSTGANVAVGNGETTESGGGAAAGLIGSGGALAVAWLCNKALIPVRVPITLALTPPIARFLTARGFRI
ncbi:unnamed protein product [Closterium sp. Naga37s-1]|nr:unnamed protein product [Closterium sp. Naga37s-1]